MERRLDNILPILGAKHDCILSKQGDIAIAREARLPELFTYLSGSSFFFRKTGAGKSERSKADATGKRSI